MAFSQTGTIFQQWVTLQDRGTTGSQLFAGSLIYCFSDDIVFVGNIHQGIQPKMLPTTPDFVGSNVGSVWQNLIVNNSYAGIDNPKITLNGRWTTDVGSASTDGTQLLLTPYKIVILANSGRTLHLRDERIISQMAIESGSQFYGENGMPVVITDYSMTAKTKGDKNSVSWSITMMEDKV